jgi:putative transposase
LVEKKISGLPLESKRKLIDRESDSLTIERQCQLVELGRSSYYYEPCCDNEMNLILMREIDLIYTMRPYYGSRRIAWALNAKGYSVGRELIVKLMKKMGLEAIYAKPKRWNTSHPDHKVYPYLLRGVEIRHKDHVWSMDITYIRMRNGFLYLAAIMDWFCRYVLSWRLSNSLEGAFCREALQEALRMGKPHIFNTDQGSQFTSQEFTSILESHGIKVSMDGRGRALDNIFIERLWRSVKQEEVYLKDYKDGLEAYHSIDQYFRFYNEDRPHSSLDYISPAIMYKYIDKSEN